ncbi:MAG: NUDIX domain-containing protein [Clostridia bacterium]|nr:NUDIX domain-containing protein [Clostridia bacterium]
MRELAVYDYRNYIENGTVGKRPSVRGVIIRGNRIAMAHSLRYDYYKFPGGGIDGDETHTETLIREVKEETGLTVIESSVSEYGYVLRKEKGKHEDLFIQENFYYFCDVTDTAGDQILDEYEAFEEFVPEWVEPETAIEANLYHDHKDKNTLLAKHMMEREAAVLRLLLDEGKFGPAAAEANAKRSEQQPDAGQRHQQQRQYTGLDEARKLIDDIIKRIRDEEAKRGAYVHLYGVGLMASLLALRRGYDRKTAEMAEVAGMLHDLLTYVDRNEDTDDHAHKCADYAKEHVLDCLKCYSEAEKEMIFNGIRNHSDKHIKGFWFDEIIKDADALQHSLRNPVEDYFYYHPRVHQVIDEVVNNR